MTQKNKSLLKIKAIFELSRFKYSQVDYFSAKFVNFEKDAFGEL